MRVLHISTAKSWRGGERQVKFLIDGQKTSGVEVYLMSPPMSELSIRCAESINKVITYNHGLLNAISNLKRLRNVCLKHKIDLIHAHDSHAHTLLWLAIKYSKLSVSSLVTRRLANPIRSSSLKKYNCAQINKIVCVSNAVFATMKKDISDLSRLSVIYSGIEIDNKVKENKVIDQLTIGYVAAFTEEKDHLSFVQVAKAIERKFPNVNFLLVGDGPLLSEIKEACYDFRERVKFTGFVKDVDSEYAKMDIILHTSRQEALGTALIDGMKFGIPIVANDVGGVSELIDHGQNGFLSPKNDAKQKVEFITRLLENSALRIEFGERSKKKAFVFDKDVMVVKYQELYNQILEM